MPNSTPPLTDTGDVALGVLVRQFRRAAGLSQEELAARATLSARTLSNLERGAIRKPQVDTLRLIADALGLSPMDRARLEMALHRQNVTPPPSENGAASEARKGPPAHLPTPLTPLIGRAHELAGTVATLRRDDVRLVTLTGPGGIGKTRLALAVAGELRWEFADGVFFVSLAPVREPDLLFLTVAQVLGVKTATQRPYEAVGDWLRERRVLLVLDNFEHLLSEAVTVANLLLSCPHLHVLATSRARLHLRGEHEYSLSPLALPAVGDHDALAVVMQSSAVQMFAHYAQAAQPDFTVTAGNAAAVGAICAHLDGLPLALELAAARVRWFTPEALLARLTTRSLPELVDGARDVSPRQQTLRHTIAWSYDLLGEGERRLFARFAVFAGAANGAALMAVDGPEAARRAEALAEQSLLTVTPDEDGTPRYGMLETVREFAQEQLERRDDADKTRRRHAEYFITALAETAAHWRTPTQAWGIARLDRDYDDLRSVLQWAQEKGAARIGLQCAGSLAWYWDARGYFIEGEYWLNAMLSLPAEDVAPVVRAKALNGAGLMAYERGDSRTAIARYEAALGLLRDAGESRETVRTLNYLGLAAFQLGNYAQATEWWEENLALYRQMDDPVSIAAALHNLGTVAFNRGEYEHAALLIEESIAYKRAGGNVAALGMGVEMLGYIAMAQHDLARATGYFEEALQIQRNVNNRKGIANAFSNLGLVAYRQGVFDRAAALFGDALPLRWEAGDARGAAFELRSLGDVARRRGDRAEARARYMESFATVRPLAFPQGMLECLLSFGMLLLAEGGEVRAARILGAVTEHADCIEYTFPYQQEEYDVALAFPHVAGAEAVAAWEAGKALSLEEALDDAMQGATCRQTGHDAVVRSPAMPLQGSRNRSGTTTASSVPVKR